MSDDLSFLKSFPKAKTYQNKVLICCPFHQDKNPSCSVNVQPPYFGRYKCWSCGASGGYSELMAGLGLDASGVTPTPKIDTESYQEFFTVPNDVAHNLNLYDLTAKNCKRIGIEEGWRGFKLEFLRTTVRAKICTKEDSTRPYLYFPVLVQGKEVGHVRANLKKAKGRPSYLNMPGSWSKTKGLLLYDQAVDLMRTQGHTTMVVAEGPRSGFRLLRDKIPAVCMLGVSSWSDHKRLLLEMAGVETLISATDGDDAGYSADKTLRENLKGFLHFKKLRLYDYEGELDPFSMPSYFIDKLKSMLE